MNIIIGACVAPFAGLPQFTEQIYSRSLYLQLPGNNASNGKAAAVLPGKASRAIFFYFAIIHDSAVDIWKRSIFAFARFGSR